MPRLSKAERLAKLHADALIEFDEIQAAARQERLQCLQDRRFCSIPGAQWEGGLGDQFENKPRYEFNKVQLAVLRVYNEYRGNRITVDFQPRDGAQADKLADTCDGLYRADEQACTADEAYDNCFDEGTSGGMGAFRYRAVYEDDDDDENDRQRIAIEPIFDADTCVFWDLNAKRYDKADGKRCYVLTPYSRRAYKDEFGDDPVDWPHSINQVIFDWCTPDIVWVAELYCVEESSQMVRIYLDLADEEVRVTEDDLAAEPELLDRLIATGHTLVRQKRQRQREIVKYLMSGGKMLTEGETIPGRCIPVTPFYGKRWVIDGIERCMGHVRLAKDAQRLVNMLLSWLAEIAARSPVEVPIMTPEQIGQHGWMWAQQNVDQFPYLLAEMVTDAEGNPVPGSQAPIGYYKTPNIPQPTAMLAQLAIQALEEMLGNQQAGEKLEPNMSGKAVELIQTRLDKQTFIYMSNFRKTVKRGGEIWLSMKKAITVEPDRRMKTVGPNGEASSVVLNRPAYNAETGEEYLENDLSNADMEVVVDVGPSSTSKRAATVRELTGMMQLAQDPDTVDVLTSLAMMNMEGEGINDARQYFRRKMVRKGVVQPTDDELQEMQQEAANQQPDPNAQYLQAAAEQALAEAGQARAKTVQTIADADLKRAQTAETYAGIQDSHHQQMLATYQALQQALQPPPAA